MRLYLMGNGKYIFFPAATSETPSYALPPTPPSPTATALSHWVTAAKMVQQQQQRQMQQPQQVKRICQK